MPRTTTMTVRVSGALSEFVATNVGEGGAYENVSEYIREGVGVWRPVRDLDDPDTLRCPDGIEAGAELGVGVADQETWRDPLISAPYQRVAGLLRHPCRVGGIGRGAAEHAAAAEVDEDQHIGRQRATGGEHGLGEEVAGDHAFNVRPDECGDGPQEPRASWAVKPA